MRPGAPLSATAGLVLAAALLAGCGSGDGDRREGRGPIVFADSRDTSRGAQIRRLVEEWNRTRPEERVDMVQLAESSDDHRAQVVARAQDTAAARERGGSGPVCFDVVTVDVIHTAEYARWGYIEPLGEDDFDHEAFLSKPIESVRHQDRLWGIPLRSDVGLLYYRKDVLGAAGVRTPPASWEELRRLASTVPEEPMEGYITQLDRYEGFTVNVLEQVWGTGGEVLGPDGGAVARPADLEEGFARLRRGVRERWISPRSAGLNEEMARSAFQDGRALFMRNWTYAFELLNAEDSPVADKVGVAPLPTPSALGGWNLALSSCSTRQRTALEFMRYLSSRRSEEALFRGAGFAPSRKALYEDARLLREHPHLRTIRTAIEGARNRGRSPYYNRVSAAFQANLHGALTGSETIGKGMDGLKEDLYRAADGR